MGDVGRRGGGVGDAWVTASLTAGCDIRGIAVDGVGVLGLPVVHLSRQQREVLAAILLLLVVGWAVKAWRLSHPPMVNAVAAQEANAERELR